MRGGGEQEKKRVTEEQEEGEGVEEGREGLRRVMRVIHGKDWGWGGAWVRLGLAEGRAG